MFENEKEVAEAAVKEYSDFCEYHFKQLNKYKQLKEQYEKFLRDIF